MMGAYPAPGNSGLVRHGPTTSSEPIAEVIIISRNHNKAMINDLRVKKSDSGGQRGAQHERVRHSYVLRKTAPYRDILARVDIPSPGVIHG